MREICRQLIGGEIDIVEGDDAADGMLADLRTPAGLRAGVEALTQGEAEFFPEGDQLREVFAARAVGVVIVVGPAEAQFILAGLLELGGAVAALPVFSLGGEEEVAGPVLADVFDGGIDEAFDDLELESKFVIIEIAAAASELFEMVEAEDGMCGVGGFGVVGAGSVAFDDFELRLPAMPKGEHPVGRHRIAFNVVERLMDRSEVGEGVNLEGEGERTPEAWAGGGQEDGREDAARMVEFHVPPGVGAFSDGAGGVSAIPGRAETRFKLGRMGNGDVIDPIVKARAGFGAHAFG